MAACAPAGRAPAIGDEASVLGRGMDTSRVIIHLDLDAFYAQVEAARIAVDLAHRALGVEQWHSLIAVS
jgi:hypothetical protein